MTTAVAVKEQTGLAIESWDSLLERATYFAKSKLIPQHLQGKPEDVAIILQMGWELGIAPLQAINGITVIQGKPGVSPELAIALIRANTPNAYIKTTVDEAKLIATCTMAPSKERIDEGFTSTWTMERAKKMGLTNKDNYLKQPATMLKWRAVGEAARTVFPHVTKGLKLDVEWEGDGVEGDHSSNNPGSDKVNALNAILNKKEEREVQSEVVTPTAPPVQTAAIEPEVLPAEQPEMSFEDAPAGPLTLGLPKDEEDPGNYVIKVGTVIKGKRLSEVPLETLKAAINGIGAKPVKSGAEVEFLQNANFYLAQSAQAAGY